MNVRIQPPHNPDALSGNLRGTSATSEHAAVEDDVLAESKQRRLLELRLLHHWMTVVSRPFMDRPAPRWGELWRLDLPLIAFGSDLVLHALLSMSATHLLRTISEDTDDYALVLAARDQYFVLALQAQRSAVESLEVNNVDELSFAGLLISLNAFSMLRERSLGLYEPPMAWLEMGRGAGTVMRRAAEMVGDASEQKLREIIRVTAPIHQNFDKQAVDESILRPYQPLLAMVQANRSDSQGARKDADAYSDTINYIATFRKSIQSGEPPYVHLRRICMFPFTVPLRFIELVRERRPTALVILAHFFAVIANTEALEYLGNTGDDVTVARREIVAIRHTLGEEWRTWMIWPMDEVRAEA